MTGQRSALCRCGHPLTEHHGRSEGCFACECDAARPNCFRVPPLPTRRGVERPGVYAIERDGVVKFGSTTGNRHISLCRTWGWELVAFWPCSTVEEMLHREADLLALAAAVLPPANHARDWLPGGGGYTECFSGDYKAVMV